MWLVLALFWGFFSRCSSVSDPSSWKNYQRPKFQFGHDRRPSWKPTRADVDSCLNMQIYFVLQIMRATEKPSLILRYFMRSWSQVLLENLHQGVAIMYSWLPNEVITLSYKYFLNHFLTDPLALKKAFTALMKSSPDVVSEQLNKLLERLREKKSSGHDISEQCGELVLRLDSQFPGDVGCFCIYFLNHVVLQPGEAMFLGPNLPHAYLAGGNQCYKLKIAKHFYCIIENLAALTVWYWSQ